MANSEGGERIGGAGRQRTGEIWEEEEEEDRTRREDTRGQPQSKSESKITEVRREKSPEAKDGWDNLRKAV